MPIYLFLKHGAQQLPPVWLVQLIKLGASGATLEASGEQSQGRRRRGRGAAEVDEVVVGEGDSVVPPDRILEGDGQPEENGVAVGCHGLGLLEVFDRRPARQVEDQPPGDVRRRRRGKGLLPLLRAGGLLRRRS